MFKDLKLRSLLCFKMLGFSDPVMWSHITEEKNLWSDVIFFYVSVYGFSHINS